MPNPQPAQMEQRMELQAALERFSYINDPGVPNNGSVLVPTKDLRLLLNEATRPAADPGEYGELAKLMERMGLARDMLSGHLMPDAANAVSAGIDRLGTQAADIARLREALETADYRLHLIIEDAMEGGRAKEVAVYQAWRNDIRAALSPNPTSP